MMRPNNQNKNRSRGRNNSGRKHTNPMSRNYESNGPDVKIRGNASHIAEKYVQLARDAQATGDSVVAENYFQHAEHYFRIISAAQAQMAPRPDTASADDDGSREDADDNRPAANARSEAPRSKADAEPTTAESSPSKDGEDKPPRARRPRRRKVSEAGADAPQGQEASEDERAPAKPRARSKPKKSEDEQPDLGQLPAFLTGAGSAAE